MPSSDQNMTLVHAIMDASPELVKSALLRMIFDEHCKKVAEREFLVESGCGAFMVSAKRRKWEVCGRCSQEFNVTMNSSDDCRWHRGSLDVDLESGSWKYHEEDRDGKIDTAEMRRKFPERFVWSCCGARGDVKASGCQWDYHAEEGHCAKRTRQCV